MPFVLNAVDVLLFTSLLEGSPNLIKESMAFNLPIVLVPIGDASDVIRESNNCYLVDYAPFLIAQKL
jgi:glycosyltransferase involved in cell wall biosynthesis